jgi:protein SCO1/2
MQLNKKLVLGLVSVAIIAGFAYYNYMTTRSMSHEHGQMPSFYRVVVEPPRNAYVFSLTDQFGVKQSLGNWTGKIVLMSFMYTRCPTICPALALQFSYVENQLKDLIPQKLVLAFLTVDPEYDTPERLKAWTEIYCRKCIALTGTLEECKEVWSQYGVSVIDQEGPEVGHTIKTVIIDQNGKIRFEYYGIPDAEEMLKDINSLLTA